MAERAGTHDLDLRLASRLIVADQPQANRRCDLDDSQQAGTSLPGLAASAARRPRAQAHQRRAGLDVGSFLAV
jgi:hypothetical protein